MATGDKRIVQLGKAAATAKDGVFAIVDPITDQTVQIEVQKALGASRANMDWQSDTTYELDDIDPFKNFVLFLGLAWKSLQASNTGNIPTENTFWTAETISPADGVTDTQHTNGLFTYDDSKVIHNNAQYYLQVAAPYLSADIAAEITAGDWDAAGVPVINFLDFADQGSPPGYLAGRMWFGDLSFNLYDNISGTSIQIGKETVIDAHNGNGVTLDNFTVVGSTTQVSGVPSVIKAIADTITNANSIGVCTHDILVGEVGKVTLHGTASGDTSIWNENDLLFLSGTVAGQMTNVEQEILKPVARVLVADTEVNGGKIYVFQEGIINITALGQALGADESQALTTTPAALEVYENSPAPFELNVTVTQVGSDPYTAEMTPASIGASGFYRISFNISIDATDNQIHIFELYINGSPSGILTAIDLTNNNITAGNGSFSVLTPTKLTNSIDIEVFSYVVAGTSTITAATVTLNMERIGNV